MEKAGFFARFAAWFLDGVAVGLVGWLIVMVMLSLGVVAGSAADMGDPLAAVLTGTLSVLFIVIALAIQFVYFGYLWSGSGQSLGMKLLGIRVVHQGGEDLSFVQAGLRGPICDWISGFFFSLVYLWAAFDANQEAWHDKLFDTWVVRA